MKIKQLTSYPNSNELGLGNTNETYIRIENSIDVSDMFPPNKDVVVYDNANGKSFVVKAKKEPTEFRINQLGKLYRDYNFNPGDELKFTYVEQQGKTTVFFQVTNYTRAFLCVNSKGTEISNIGVLSSFIVDESQKEFELHINEGVLSLKFNKSEKKRSDSPYETDFYEAKVNDKLLAKGNYYVTITGAKNVLEEVKKNVVEEYYLPDELPTLTLSFQTNDSLQQIFYGAPGTGKSHTVCEVTKLQPKENVFRTTFHPDSDYSSFVGCYKPTKQSIPATLTKIQLTAELARIKESGVTYPCQRFSAMYFNSLRGLSAVEQKEILSACGFSDSFATEISKGIAVGDELMPKRSASITYEFVPQAFINAYVRAYHTDSPVFLVIEEINRGNCAQIFGDMFQLLDRGDSGESDYAIKPDTDIQNYLSKVMTDAHTDDEAIKRGEEMKLPYNLFIWATMNTSDQSLFPIDSAFKRRWDWKYMPIDTTKEQWAIKVNGKDYSWGSFLDQVNDEIGETTSSEDKKLGFYFCKACDTTITAERFVSKVLFYIYNDVFKDYGLDSREFFKDKETGKVITFQSLFNMDGSVKEPQVEKILTNLKVTVVSASTSTNEETENDAIDSDTKGDHKESLVAVTIDGERIASATQFDTYLNALKKIGIDRMGPAIEALKYQRRGSKMATKTKEPSIETATGYSYVEADGYYFVKGMNGYTMVRILEDLNKAYDLNLQIEYK